ncbi:hypothetical protein [Butyrivibrio sp. TB]|uniref:hypothetical protein n=1 Tax=Butyrivibrio sp. TB TaxID=1520809 RepID=UPI0008B91382|nr:hypothetical protein [Butyrivibrio sp. TB]SEQ59381.1 hypothetical protein SAMN02910382_03531 [Butyrivibrio sp. TB]
MNRDIFIRNLTKEKIEMSPKGRKAGELSPEEFEKCYENFFDMIFEIAATDVSAVEGYGEFDENNKAPYKTLEDFIRADMVEEPEDVPDYSEYFMSELVRIPLRLISKNNDEPVDSGAEDFSDLPLIVIYENHTFSVPYQQEYLKFLKQEKRNSHYAFVFARNEEYRFFWNNFGKNFQR